MGEERPTRGFIEELQAMSEPKKKQVIIIATIVVMVIVVGIWFSYFNGILANASQPTVADTASTTSIALAPVPSSATANGPSMWQNIENGMASIGNFFKGPSNYNIQPSK